MTHLSGHRRAGRPTRGFVSTPRDSSPTREDDTPPPKYNPVPTSVPPDRGWYPYTFSVQNSGIRTRDPNSGRDPSVPSLPLRGRGDLGTTIVSGRRGTQHAVLSDCRRIETEWLPNQLRCHETLSVLLRYLPVRDL